MAEYNKGRYYWIKLTDRFLESDTVDFLMSQKDGANYVVLYQMLCLKTVNNNGVLARQLGEILIPYDIEKIARDCKFFSVDTVRVALELYKRLGLVYEQEDGILRISDFERLIGSQTIGAEKKQLQLQNRGGNKVENLPPDIEKDIDIEIDKEKDKKRKGRKKENKEIEEREQGKVDRSNSHDKIMERRGVVHGSEYYEVLVQFLQMCYANGHLVTDSKLDDILCRLNNYYADNEKEKIRSVRIAISGGYFDVVELREADEEFRYKRL